MDMVENFIIGQVCTYGRVWNVTNNEYDRVTPDLVSKPPSVYLKTKEIAGSVLKLPTFDGGVD